MKSKQFYQEAEDMQTGWGKYLRSIDHLKDKCAKDGVFTRSEYCWTLYGDGHCSSTWQEFQEHAKSRNLEKLTYSKWKQAFSEWRNNLFAPVPLPKHIERRVVWHQANGQSRGTAILLVGYCPDTLPYFTVMAEDLKKRIPAADINQAICGKVKESSTVKGFTLLMAPIHGPKRKLEAFKEFPSIDFNY